MQTTKNMSTGSKLLFTIYGEMAEGVMVNILEKVLFS